MAIDKSNSKPWVKVTVWVLTISLMFAFTAGGLIYFYYMVRDSAYMRGSNSIQQQFTPTEDAQVSDDEIRAAYEAQIAQYETAYKQDESDTDRENLAAMSASYGSWLYQRGNVADYPQALQLFERALELDPDQQGEGARQFIDQIKAEMSE